MAMNGDDLGIAIANVIIDSSAPESAKAICREFWKKISNAIVEYITNNAEVEAGIPVSTEGTQTAQTGKTTAPGSIV